MKYSEKSEIVKNPCAVCGRPNDIEADHIVPRSKGGSNHVTNFQPLCRVCNAVKRHTRSNEDVSAWIVLNLEKFINNQKQRTARLLWKKGSIWPQSWTQVELCWDISKFRGKA